MDKLYISCGYPVDILWIRIDNFFNPRHHGAMSVPRIPSVTARDVRSIFRYDYETGKLYWRGKDHTSVDREADSLKDNRYYRVNINGRSYTVHRIIWLYHYEEWPTNDIDHINHIGTDNRLENLRLVSRSDNLRNSRLSRRNKSGCTGVCWRKATQMWEARIHVRGKRLFLGFFKDKDDAIFARKSADLKYGYHANHGAPAHA